MNETSVEITQAEVLSLIADRWLSANNDKLLERVAKEISTQLLTDQELKEWTGKAKTLAKNTVNDRTAAWIDGNVRGSIESELEKYMDVRAENLLKNVYRPSEAEMQKLFQRCVSRIVSHALGSRVNDIAGQVTGNILAQLNTVEVYPDGESA